MRRAANRTFCGAIMVAALAVSSCGKSPMPTTSAERELNIFSWSDFLAPDVLADFEKETGIRVHVVTYPSQEALEATLLTGHTGYDLAVVASSELSRLTRARVFRELDRSKLPDWSNLDSEVMARLAKEDPENRYAVAYDWGTTAIAYDVEKIKQFAPDAPLTSWRMLFDPSVISKYASCGISIVDAPSELVAIALIANGANPNTTDEAQLASAGRKLMAIRRYVRKIDGDMQISDLASGDICLMVTWTSNFVIARRRAAEAGSRAEFRYVIPEEGTIAWQDAFAIPVDAPHVNEAYTFVNFTMRADNAARGAIFLGNASANRAAVPRIDKLLRDDPAIYPPPQQRRMLQALHSRPDAANRRVTRIWTQFRTGH